MPFPKLNVNFHRGFGTCQIRKVQEDEQGNIITTMEDCNKKLPEAENFEIQNQLKAGLNLQEVNTKIKGADIDEKELTEAFNKMSKN